MKAHSSIHCIPSFDDNYIWLIEQEHHACIVDPGDAQPVLKFLKKHNLKLTHVLITHWHPDHIGGIDGLKKAYPDIAIITPNSEHISSYTHRASRGTIIKFFSFNFETIEVPGHTLDHIVYYCPDNEVLFSGDTLFAGGCGRVFEGTHAQMLSALNNLKSLPQSTKVYCAHEYTLSNLEFGAAVEPENLNIKSRITNTQIIRDAEQPSVPSTIKLELETNVFLRCHLNLKRSDYIQADNDQLQVFQALREWKNIF